MRGGVTVKDGNGNISPLHSREGSGSWDAKDIGRQAWSREFSCHCTGVADVTLVVASRPRLTKGRDTASTVRMNRTTCGAGAPCRMACLSPIHTPRKYEKQARRTLRVDSPRRLIPGCEGCNQELRGVGEEWLHEERKKMKSRLSRNRGSQVAYLFEDTVPGTGSNHKANLFAVRSSLEIRWIFRFP
jgi:hypothetical protein